MDGMTVTSRQTQPVITYPKSSTYRHKLGDKRTDTHTTQRGKREKEKKRYSKSRNNAYSRSSSRSKGQRSTLYKSHCLVYHFYVNIFYPCHRKTEKGSKFWKQTTSWTNSALFLLPQNFLKPVVNVRFLPLKLAIQNIKTCHFSRAWICILLTPESLPSNRRWIGNVIFSMPDSDTGHGSRVQS